MSELISKELLSLVLGAEVNNTPFTHEEMNNLLCYEIKKYPQRLNLDTLGRLCKEWCAEYMDITSEINSFGIEVSTCNRENDEVKFFKANTELEAIIKATEYVAKEKGLI